MWKFVQGSRKKKEEIFKPSAEDGGMNGRIHTYNTHSHTHIHTHTTYTDTSSLLTSIKLAEKWLLMGILF